MKIVDHFIGTGAGANRRIRIISGGGSPMAIPREWRPVMDSCDTLVVIPDMHMFVRNSPQDNFRFGAEAFLRFLDHLEARKEDFAAEGNTLRIYQLGDLYELRFPSPAHAGENVGAAEIRMSDPEYDLIVNRLDHLRTHFLYGNHDFELRHYPSCRFYALEGGVYLEHGFAASPWSEDPRRPLWDPAMLGFKTLRDIEAQFVKLLVAAHAIGKDDHFAVGTADGSVERGEYPDEAAYPPALLSHYAGKLFSDPGIAEPRIRIIGHTHHPLLRLVRPAGGAGCILADAGAWTEGRSDFVVVTDEEIAICRYARA